MGADDLKAVLDRECSLPVEVARTFWAHIDPAVAADLSYTFEEINFTASRTETQRLRSAAYKLTEKPETLTDEEFELLLREGKDKLQNDGLILGEIGVRLMGGGDLEGAFDWLLLSILAIRKHGEKQSGTVLALPLINYLELVAKISSTHSKPKTAET